MPEYPGNSREIRHSFALLYRRLLWADGWAYGGLMEGLHLLCAGLPDVAPGRGLDRLVLRIAESLGSRFRLAGLRFQPLHPVCPPAAWVRLCGRKPGFRVDAQFTIGPEAALVLRCGVDHARNMTARAKHELSLPAADQLRRAIRAFPRHDVVLQRGEHIARHVDAPQVHWRATYREMRRLAQVVLEVHVAQVPGVHRPGQVGAVRIPVQQVERLRRATLEVVVDDVRPYQVVGAQRLEHEAEFLTRVDAAATDGLFALRHPLFIDEHAQVARVAEIQHGREKREARH